MVLNTVKHECTLCVYITHVALSLCYSSTTSCLAPSFPSFSHRHRCPSRSPPRAVSSYSNHVQALQRTTAGTDGCDVIVVCCVAVPKPFTEMSVMIKKREFTNVMQFKYEHAPILCVVLCVVTQRQHLGCLMICVFTSL